MEHNLDRSPSESECELIATALARLALGRDCGAFRFLPVRAAFASEASCRRKEWLLTLQGCTEAPQMCAQASRRHVLAWSGLQQVRPAQQL